MSEILSDIFKKYGIKAVVFASVFAILVWAFAHFAAAPGTEVSVLWGLVRYTKSMDKESEYSSKNPVEYNNKTTEDGIIQKKDTVFSPISIFTKYDLNKDDVDEFINDYRNKNKVREIQIMESGKPAKELSDGIYSFIESFAFSIFLPRYNNNYKSFLLNWTTSRFRNSDSEYEIHFINKDKIILLGFTNRKDASDISYLSGRTKHSILLSPTYFGDFTTFVAIPVDRIISSYDRTITISQNKFYYILEASIK